MHPHAEIPWHEVRSIIVTSFDGLGLCQLIQFEGRSLHNLANMIALSLQGNIALVALFTCALWLDRKGC